MTEQIKVLEIDQKNLIQAKELQNKSKEIMRVEHERLSLMVQQFEVECIKRKSRLAGVIEQVKQIFLFLNFF